MCKHCEHQPESTVQSTTINTTINDPSCTASVEPTTTSVEPTTTSVEPNTTGAEPAMNPPAANINPATGHPFDSGPDVEQSEFADPYGQVYDPENGYAAPPSCDIEAMLRFAKYVNQVTPMSREGHADRYLRMTQAYMRGELDSPTPEEVEYLMQMLAAEWPEAAANGSLENCWRPRITACAMNPGYYWFMREWGHTSSVGAAWMTDVCLTSPMTLEVAYGYYRTLEEPDKWQLIDDYDPYMRWSAMSATFQEARVRAKLGVDTLDYAKHCAHGEPASALIVGSGRLPELRYAGYAFEPEHLQIYTLDQDPDNDATKLLTGLTPEYVQVAFPAEGENATGMVEVSVNNFLDAGHTLHDLGVHHFNASIQDFLTAGDTQVCADGTPVSVPAYFDAIVMNGVSMYLGADLPRVLKGLVARLNLGGRFFWDYSFPNHWDLARSVLCFGWNLRRPELMGNRGALQKLAATIEAAPNDPLTIFALVKQIFADDPTIQIEMCTEDFVSPANAVYFTFTRLE